MWTITAAYDHDSYGPLYDLQCGTETVSVGQAEVDAEMGMERVEGGVMLREKKSLLRRLGMSLRPPPGWFMAAKNWSWLICLSMGGCTRQWILLLMRERCSMPFQRGMCAILPSLVSSYT